MNERTTKKGQRLGHASGLPRIEIIDGGKVILWPTTPYQSNYDAACLRAELERRRFEERLGKLTPNARDAYLSQLREIFAK